jgi:hypothetical protein
LVLRGLRDRRPGLVRDTNQGSGKIQGGDPPATSSRSLQAIEVIDIAIEELEEAELEELEEAEGEEDE